MKMAAKAAHRRLPLHQPSVFPGYLAKTSNGFELPEKRKKISGQLKNTASGLQQPILV